MTCSICKQEKEIMISTRGMDDLDDSGVFDSINGEICVECAMKLRGVDKLYHVSLDKRVHTLTPRIPSQQCDFEDETIPRVCTASTVEGALGAVPWGGSVFSDLFNTWGSAAIKVLEFKVEDIGYENILPAEYLYQKDLIRDALIYGEYWITKEVKPSNEYFIVVENYEEGFVDNFSYKNYLLYLDGELEAEDLTGRGTTTIGYLDFFSFDDADEITGTLDTNLVVKAKRNDQTEDQHITDLENILDQLFPDGEFYGEIEKVGDRFVITGTVESDQLNFHKTHSLQILERDLHSLFTVLEIEMPLSNEKIAV